MIGAIGWLELASAAGIESVCDVGCGCVEDAARSAAVVEGSIRYHGIHESRPLVAHHSRTLPWFHAEAVEMEAAIDPKKFGRGADLVILNDALARVCNGAAGQVLTNVSAWPWRWLLVSTAPHASNRTRHRVRSGNLQPYNVEAGLIKERIGLGPPLTRCRRASGGEWLLWVNDLREGRSLARPAVEFRFGE
jgi:hypothetical protein